MNDLFTPSEIVERNPKLVNIGWTPQKIGVLFSLGLVKGYQNRNKRSVKINEPSLLDLCKIRNKHIEESIIS